MFPYITSSLPDTHTCKRHRLGMDFHEARIGMAHDKGTAHDKGMAHDKGCSFLTTWVSAVVRELHQQGRDSVILC